MLYHTKPSGFKPAFNAVSCIIEFEKNILMLKRSTSVEFSGAYGAPTGKMNHRENIREAMIREIVEETGIALQEQQLTFLKTFYVQYPQYEFIYHLFTHWLTARPDIRLNPREHSGYCWIKKDAAFNLPLIPDMKPCLEYYYARKLTNDQ